MATPEKGYVTNPRTNRKITVGGAVYNKLLKEGVTFTLETGEAPKPLANVIGFWKPEQENGYLSQWYLRPFTIGDTFSCAEQWMMVMKAKVFHDEEMAKKILAERDPKKMKALGRKVKGFTDARWDDVKYQIVLEGNLAKFRQNPDLLARLLKTGDATLVEASPRDKVWGVGTSKLDPAAWTGQNLLGKALMETRRHLS